MEAVSATRERTTAAAATMNCDNGPLLSRWRAFVLPVGGAVTAVTAVAVGLRGRCDRGGGCCAT